MTTGIAMETTKSTNGERIPKIGMIQGVKYTLFPDFDDVNILRTL